MEALFRAFRKTPRDPSPKNESQNNVRHEKLPEGWEENKEAVKGGILFYAKYVGSTLLDEIPDGESYGDGISSKAVQNIVDMAKTAGKKLRKVALMISQQGIKVNDMQTKESLVDSSITRISFCTADKTHDKVFAYIARNSINETTECHAFLCTKRKIAQAITLTVFQSFNVAKDKWEELVKQKHQKQIENRRISEENNISSHNSKNSEKSSESSPSERLEEDKSEKSEDGDSTASQSSSENISANQFVKSRKEWECFEDDFDDTFSRFAENRIMGSPAFKKDIKKKDERGDSIEKYMLGNTFSEEFIRNNSSNDLKDL